MPNWPTHGRVGLDCETRDPLLTKLGPGVRRGYSLDELLGGVSAENLHAEVDVGAPRGGEVW